MQAGKIPNHPLAVVWFPIQRRLPKFGVSLSPAGGMPPAKIAVAAVVHELKIIADTDQRAIDFKIFEPNLVLRPLVVPGELVVFGVRRLAATFTHALPNGRATAPLRISQFKQSTLNLNHPRYAFD